MANIQIPNLPVATSLSGAEELEIVQGGVSRRTTTQAIADLNPPQGTVTQINTGGGLSGGPITTTGTITIAGQGVDNTKLAVMPALTVKGNDTAVTGAPTDIDMATLSSMLSLAPSATIDTTNASNITSGQLSDQRYWQTLSSAIDRMINPITPDIGTMLYYGASGWTGLNNGVNGQVLRSRGSGQGPEWFTTTGTGTVTQVDSGTGLTGGPITTSGTLSIANTGVTAASYGVASKTITFSVNAQGQLTTAAAIDINIDASQVTSGILPVTRGGNGIASYTIGDILYASAPLVLSKLPAGTVDYALVSNGPSLPPAYKQINLTTAVTGTLPAANGGTGNSSYVVGDLLYANTSSSLARLADVATGNALISGGIGVAPSWGKIDLTTTISGILPVANGGTGVATLTGYVKGNGASVFTASATIPNTDITGLGTMSVQNAGSVAITGGTATLSSVTLTSGTISTTPSGSTDIVNKAYVDSVAEGLKIKTSCEYATTGNITLSGLGTQAGGDWPSSLTAGMRILVKNQTTQADNGIYAADSSGWTRTSDANTWDELVSAFTFVHQGTTQSDTGWVCTIDPGGTLGVTPITWTQFSGAGTYLAGTGLTLTGTTFSITNTGVAAASYGTASSVPTIAINAQGQITSASNTAIAIDASAITTGTLGVVRGGTGLSSIAAGDLLYGSATNTLSTLAGAATTNVLLSGGVSGAPSWGKVDLTSAVANALPIGNGGTGQTNAAAGFDALAPTTTRGDIIYRNATTNTRLAVGTANYALLSNGTDPVWGQVSLSAGVTGTLPAVNGGTGIALYAVGDLLFANTTTTLDRLPPGTAGYALLSNGAGTSPGYGQVNLATAVTGTLPISNGGTGATSATAAFDALAPTTTQGDLIIYNGTDNVRLPIGTANYVLVSNGTTASWAQVSLTAGVTGTLPTGNGGTGLTTFTAANNAIYSTSASALTAGTLPIAAGGTGATTIAGAQASLQVDPAGTAIAMAIALG